MASNAFEYGHEELVLKVIAPDFVLFIGDRCEACSKTVNFLSYSVGWRCVCGRYNPRYLKNDPPWENPDLGPSRKRIEDAVRDGRRRNGKTTEGRFAMGGCGLHPEGALIVVFEENGEKKILCTLCNNKYTPAMLGFREDEI